MIAKVGLGVIGLGAISIGGVAFTKPEWLGINREAPWTPLSKDHNFSASSATYGTNTFGNKYKGVLTGVVGTKSDENTNEDWWKKAFEQLKIDSKISNSNVGEKFKYDDDKSNSKVNQGISGTSGDKGLNQICNEAYKSSTNNITSTGGGDNYKESDVWKYCSPLGGKLKTISDSDSNTYTTSGQIGENATNKTKLVSTTGNDKFWELRDKEFRGVGKYQKIEDEDDDFFNPNKGKSIKDLCEDAYKRTAVTGNSSTTAPTSAKALKYCSINKE